ncbi:MAG: hypothetical protein V1875_09970 [Candidatus Altiarchaeota archaeon]
MALKVKRAAKQKKKYLKSKAKLKKPPKKARISKSDSELSRIGRELRRDSRPAMFRSGGSEDSTSKLVKLDAEARTDSMMSYYRDMMFRCVKCDGKFDHKASLPPLEYELKCPHCSEVHVLKFTPASNLFTVQSKTVDVMENV